MAIIKETTFEKARKSIRAVKPPIIFSSDNDYLNRKILEKEKINTLLLNQKNIKDFAKQRNSGLNQVMTKIAKKNNISIGINLDEILRSNGKEKSQILARVQQNIKLCNKAKLKMTFIGKKRDSHDLKALGLVLRMPTSMTKFFN